MLRRKMPLSSTQTPNGKPEAPRIHKPFVSPMSKRSRSDQDDEEENSQQNRERNASAMRDGVVMVQRSPFLSFLSVSRGHSAIAKAFKLPGGAKRTEQSVTLLRQKTLGLRKVWGKNLPVDFKKHEVVGVATFWEIKPLCLLKTKQDITITEDTTDEFTTDTTVAVEAIGQTQDENVPPLVLWTVQGGEVVTVDPLLARFLRPHQREGVQFMFECVCGLRDYEGNGCILADDMGLGKTLQSIALLWTLLQHGQRVAAPVNKILIVCPTSLVKNWDDEIRKWVNKDLPEDRPRLRTLALSEASRDEVIRGIKTFITNASIRVIILSYETFRIHSSKFTKNDCCDLLICDEAHRLKNGNSLTNRALAALPCKKRVLLSGTPMQNDLEEFYAMVDFTNPNVLGDPTYFRKMYMNPILVGREPDASDKEKEIAQERTNELSDIINMFILRRTNTLNAKHLPPKLTQVVCCRLTEAQQQLYNHLLEVKIGKGLAQASDAKVLSCITLLKKLCNHPKLIQDEKKSGVQTEESSAILKQYLSNKSSSLSLSGKIMVLARLMQQMKKKTTDRIVIVSNYTQTLDVFAELCRDNAWMFIRLDGSTTASKRKKLVDEFNQDTKYFAFLLSSKAGGCGLNLIGANRLVLFDPDWNPATDKQAAARVWREGQPKRCFVYRFVATGTIEEKIFQRQLSKEGLQNIVNDKDDVNLLSSKDLKKLFKLRDKTLSDTHDKLKCSRCRVPFHAHSDDEDHEEESVAKQDPVEQLEECRKILAAVQGHKLSPPFFLSVPGEDEADAEEYLITIELPMDLTMIQERLFEGTYTSAAAFLQDMALMFQNSLLFYHPQHNRHRQALKLQAFFEKKSKKLAESVRTALPSLDESGTRTEQTAGLDTLENVEQSDGGPVADATSSESKTPEAMESEQGDESFSFSPQIGLPAEDDLNCWAHHLSYESVDDEIMRGAVANTSLVSFIFACHIDGDVLAQQALEDAKTSETRPKRKISYKKRRQDDSVDSTSLPGSSDDDDLDKLAEELGVCSNTITSSTRVPDLAADGFQDC